jgi:hypothetical protein
MTNSKRLVRLNALLGGDSTTPVQNEDTSIVTGERREKPDEGVGLSDQPHLSLAPGLKCLKTPGDVAPGPGLAVLGELGYATNETIKCPQELPMTVPCWRKGSAAS